MSAFRLARWASATSYSTCAGDFIPSWKASTHSARYCGAPYTTGLGVGAGEAALGLAWATGGADPVPLLQPASTATTTSRTANRLRTYVLANRTWLRPTVSI